MTVATLIVIRMVMAAARPAFPGRLDIDPLAVNLEPFDTAQRPPLDDARKEASHAEVLESPGTTQAPGKAQRLGLQP